MISSSHRSKIKTKISKRDVKVMPSSCCVVLAQPIPRQPRIPGLQNFTIEQVGQFLDDRYQVMCNSRDLRDVPQLRANHRSCSRLQEVGPQGHWYRVRANNDLSRDLARTHGEDILRLAALKGADCGRCWSTL